MSSATTPTLIAIGCQIALGLVVFQANRHRLANKCFLLLSLVIAGWLATLYLAFIAGTAPKAEFSIRLASIAGAAV